MPTAIHKLRCRACFDTFLSQQREANHKVTCPYCGLRTTRKQFIIEAAWIVPAAWMEIDPTDDAEEYQRVEPNGGSD